MWLTEFEKMQMKIHVTNLYKVIKKKKCKVVGENMMGKMRKTEDHISEVWATQLSETVNLPIKGNISVVYKTAGDLYHHSGCTEPHQFKKLASS